MQIFFNHNTKFQANTREKKCTIAGFGITLCGCSLTVKLNQIQQIKLQSHYSQLIENY